ncbi:hypothetical protein, partial [Pseudomonas syringae]|uniref:hypothetical protein n=1 Tax=Pseudomonas syringae TaxID=317 RepID=UPI001F081EA9
MSHAHALIREAKIVEVMAECSSQLLVLDQAIENGTAMQSVFTVHDANFVRSTMSNVDTWYTQFPGVT